MLKRWGLPLLVTMGLVLAIGAFAALAGPGSPSDGPPSTLSDSPEDGSAANILADVLSTADAAGADGVDEDVDANDQGEDADDDDQGEDVDEDEDEDVDEEVCEADEVAVEEVDEDGEVECEDIDDGEEVEEIDEDDDIDGED